MGLDVRTARNGHPTLPILQEIRGRASLADAKESIF